MRRILFTLLAVAAMVAAVPAASLAVGGDHHQGDRHREREHRREHRPGHHHFQIRHERFGAIVGNHVRHDAGTVSSFANGRLTIRLNDGSSVTGAVNRFTEVECEMSGAMHRFDQGSGGSGSGSGGSGGPGHHGDRNDPGDDRGHDGPRHDGGDDHGHGGPGHHDGDRDQHHCAMITPGMGVRDATLTVTRFGAVWTRVDLIDS